MRKLTLFIFSLLMTIGAVAQVNITNTSSYTVKSVNRGFLYYDSANGDYVTSSSHTNLTDATPTGLLEEQFAFLHEDNTAEGQYYMYSVAAQKFVSYTNINGGALTLTDDPSVTWTLAKNSNYYVITVPGTTNACINITNWQATHGCKVIGTGADDGNKMTLVAVGNVELGAALVKINKFEGNYFATPEAGKYYKIKGEGELPWVTANATDGGNVVVSANEADAAVFLKTANGLQAVATGKYLGYAGGKYTYSDTELGIELSNTGDYLANYSNKYAIVSGGNYMFNNNNDGIVHESNQAHDLERLWAFTEVEAPAAKIGEETYPSLQAAIDAATEGQTIVLIRDIAASAIITINKALTLDGNGKTLTSTAARAINIETEGEVVINNLTVNAGERAFNIINKAATVELNGVTATAKNNAVMIATSAGAAEVSINNCDFTGLAVVNVAGAKSNVAIKDSKITNVDATDAENYGAITVWTSAEEAVVNVENTEINVADDSIKAYVFPGDAIVNGVDQVGYIVATIGDGGYETLANAIGSAKAGETIVLIRDITSSEIITIDKAITLDGNGKTLTSTATRAINIDTEGKVVINNLTVNAGERAFNIINKAATVELTGVTATAKNNAVMVATSAGAAKVAINGCDFTGLAVVNVAGAKSNVAIKDSKITNVDATDAENYGAITVWTSAEEAVVNVENTTITVTDDSKKAYVFPADATVNGVDEVGYIVATVGDAGYDTLEEAIKEVPAGGTIELVRNIEASEIIAINKAITIDLGGKKVTANCRKAFEVYANTTIKNGTIEALNRCVDTRKAVELTLENVNLVADKYTAEYGNPQPLTIGGYDHGTTLTINNSTISAKAGYGIISFVKTEATISNSTIGGYNAYYAKEGSNGSVFNFVKSTLTGDCTGNDVEGNSFSAIAIQEDGVTVNVDATSTVVANGNYMYAIGVGNQETPDHEGVSVTVAGKITGNVFAGKINSNAIVVSADYAEALNAKGYATVATSNGLVALKSAAAKIGDVYYTTLAAALAAEGDDVVDLLTALTLSDTEDYTFNKAVRGDVTYERMLSKAGEWMPLYVPFAISMSEEFLENYDIAYFNDVHSFDEDEDNVIERTTIELIKVTNPNATLKANYPLVIRAKSEEARALKFSMEGVTLAKAVENSVTCNSVSYDYVIKGSYQICETLADNQRVMGKSNVTGKYEWVKMASGYSLNPYRLILTITSRGNENLPFESISMRVVGEEGEDGTTQIYDVEVDAEQTFDGIFDLQGRRVLEPQKGGLYIINGKKVVVK